MDLTASEIHSRAAELAETLLSTDGMHEDYYILARAYEDAVRRSEEAENAVLKLLMGM